MSGGLILKKYVLNSDVPIPPLGDVVAFADANGNLMTKDHTGEVKLAGRFMERNSQYINQSRAGVAAGQVVQSTINAGDVVGKVMRFAGQIKCVSSVSNAANNFQVNIGGLVVPFPAFSVTVSTQYLNYEIFLSVLSANTASGFMRFSAPTAGITVATGDLEHGTVTGAIANSDISLILKNATTSSITNNFGFMEIL